MNDGTCGKQSMMAAFHQEDAVHEGRRHAHHAQRPTMEPTVLPIDSAWLFAIGERSGASPGGEPLGCI